MTRSIENPSPVLEKLFDVDRTAVNRCPACSTPFCVGELAPGTRVLVRCRRTGCKHHEVGQEFRVVVVN